MDFFKKITICITMVCAATLLTACGGLGDLGKNGSVNVFTDEKAMTKIMTEFQNREELKGKDLMVFQGVGVYYQNVKGNDMGTFITIDVLKPGTKEDVDHYQYMDGTWHGPDAVQITGDGNMEDNVIPLKAYQFDKVAPMYKVFQEKLKEENAEELSKEITLLYILGNDGSVRAHFQAESKRARYLAEFDMDGTLLEFKKS